jgi:hypothetical protein
MMELLEFLKRRHSVRQYKNEPLTDDEILALNSEIEIINSESGLNIQLVTNEPKAFSTRIAKYGKFEHVSNYFAIVGEKCKQLYEKCGYYGERLVLLAHKMGLGTCWVGIGYKKVAEAIEIRDGEELVILIAVGHGRNRGLPRKSKNQRDVSNVTDTSPEWFKLGVEAALTAPTAINQQKFYFTLGPDGKVTAKRGIGLYSKVDLGIVKYHFEIGSGIKIF